MLKARRILTRISVKTSNRYEVLSGNETRKKYFQETRCVNHRREISNVHNSVFEKHHLSRFMLGLFNRGLKIAIVLAEKQ